MKLVRTAPTSWQRADGAGGVDYRHAADGRHYRPWVLRDGVRVELEPIEQLAMAARAIEGIAHSPKSH
jgi:hypothetical protein